MHLRSEFPVRPIDRLAETEQAGIGHEAFFGVGGPDDQIFPSHQFDGGPKVPQFPQTERGQTVDLPANRVARTVHPAFPRQAPTLGSEVAGQVILLRQNLAVGARDRDSLPAFENTFFPSTVRTTRVLCQSVEVRCSTIKDWPSLPETSDDRSTGNTF